MATATPVNAIRVINSWEIEGNHGLETPCVDYLAYKALPSAVSYQGRTYGLTGWNSDTCRACFKTNAPLAFYS